MVQALQGRRRIYSPNLHTKLKPIKNHVMDGYQKGHVAIQAGGLKKANNNNINARRKKYSTKQNLS